MKKVYVFGMVVVALFSARLQGEFALEKAKVDGDSKEVMFILDAGSGEDLYYVESFVDDTDPQNPQMVRGFKKVEANFSEEYEAYLKKKSTKSISNDQ
ncbi:MAG: hypothetical protein LBD69_03810 [Puniceicoccales bacterium]|jgi:hypothetical protein|nr:hypothetical protein [Puniceicoccales bacterium]